MPDVPDVPDVPDNMPELVELAGLLGRRNRIREAITRIIGRPADPGHLGEFVASAIFNIELAPEANAKGIDGWFRHGRLKGRSVNIKYYSVNQHLLDIGRDEEHRPEFYLVLTGPQSQAASSRGEARPWVVDAVYLFDTQKLLDALTVKIGVATSVKTQYWDDAEIYPTQSSLLEIDERCRGLLAMFGRGP